LISRRNAFSALPSAHNEDELKSGVESERLKRQFYQVEGDLNLQEIFKPVPIPKKTSSSIVQSKSFKKTMKKMKNKKIKFTKS
jgi:hypothetical protein